MFGRTLCILTCFIICVDLGYGDVTPGAVRINHWFDDQIYNMTVNDVIWFKNSPLRFRKGWKEYSSARGELKGLLDKPHEGTDRLGDFATATWYLGVDDVVVALGFKVYDKKNYLILQQHYLNKTTGTSTGNKDDLISAFPGFAIDDSVKEGLGYLAYGGIMFGNDNINYGLFEPGKVNITTGTAGGPIAFFDKQDNVVIIAPFSEFMSASSCLTDSALDWGIMGGVMEVPEDFVSEYMIFYSPNGINKAFQEWGELMRNYYGKDPSYRKSDMTINFLGYWTDSGAYYFYKTEVKKTYEQTVYDIQAMAKQQGIPYRYIQYDEWFYKKSNGSAPGGTGTIYWDAMPKVFPSGMQKVYQNTEWPVFAHNMYWSNQTTYAVENGGKYKFILDPDGRALPFEERFWNDLFKYSKTWGLVVYEQDYMSDNTDAINQTVSDVTSAKTWAMQMGDAARKNGLTIQYCMEYPRHVMNALQIPVVTQARVQRDNTAGSDHWRIGVTSIFAEAMGIAPFKDNFWTTKIQPGSGHNRTEPCAALQNVVATLSTGPVGPSDMIGKTNASLLMRCCNSEGLILKPDVPVTAIDKQIMQTAYGDGIGPDGEVYTTYTDVSGYKFGVILAAIIENSFPLMVKDTGLEMGSNNTLMSSDLYVNVNLIEFNDDKPFMLTNQCSCEEFCLFYVSPRFTIGNDEVLVYGEMNKWTPISNNRVRRIRVTSTDLYLELTGGPDEVVSFRFFRNMKEEVIKCSLGPTGFSEMSFNNKRCTT